MWKAKAARLQIYDGPEIIIVICSACHCTPCGMLFTTMYYVLQNGAQACASNSSENFPIWYDCWYQLSTYWYVLCPQLNTLALLSCYEPLYDLRSSFSIQIFHSSDMLANSAQVTLMVVKELSVLFAGSPSRAGSIHAAKHQDAPESPAGDCLLHVHTHSRHPSPPTCSTTGPCHVPHAVAALGRMMCGDVVRMLCP